MIALGLLGLLGCGGDPAPPALEAKVDGWMERFDVDRAALIANRCGEPWVSIRRGAAPDAIFGLASSSKWMSAAAILAAADAGTVDLDEPVSTWLPELSSPRREATLRQLLGHRAGYQGIHPCQTDPTVSLKACALAIDETPGNPPGAAFRYSSTALTVAAAAVEAAADRPFARVFDEALARPMGLRSTRFVQAGPGNPNPAFGLQSTPDEYLAFAQMVLDDGVGPHGRVLSSRAIEAMWTGEKLPRTGFVPPALRAVPHPVHGLGVWLEDHDADGVPAIASAQGRYGFQPWIDRRYGIAAVFAVELGGPGSHDTRSSPPTVKDELAALAAELPPCD